MSIDAKFNPDFKNVKLYMLILGTSRRKSRKLPFSGPDPENVKRCCFPCNFRTTQEKKLYIFEIRIKFRVDWYIMQAILKKFWFYIGGGFLGGLYSMQKFHKNII